MSENPDYDELEKRVEKLERQALARSRTHGICDKLVENSIEGIVIIQEGYIVFANAAFSEISGYTLDELLRLSPAEVRAMIHPEDQALLWGRFKDRLEGKSVPPRYEYRGIRKYGAVRWLEMLACPVEFEGKPAVKGTVIDITDRKMAEDRLLEKKEELKESKRSKESILDSLVEHVVHQDRDLKVQWANSAACKSVGMTREELIGRYCYEIWPRLNEPCPDCPVKFSMSDGLPHEIEKLTPDGRAWYIKCYPVKDVHGNVVGTTQLTLDITESKQAEKALERSEKVYRSLFDRLPVGVFRSTPDGRFLDGNPAIVKMLGCPDFETLLATPVADFYRYPRDREKWKELIEEKGEGFSMELQWKKLDGTPLSVRESARVVRDSQGRAKYYEGVVENITKIKQAENRQRQIEKQLQHAQRMEAIGTLAGGIAHDFNNILSAIIGYTEIALLTETSGDTPWRKNFEHVLTAGERARDLVKQILAFSRQTEEYRRPVMIEPLVKEAIKLLRATIPSNIEIHHSIGPHSGSVMANPVQIQQIIMNLCTNSYHAMTEKGGVLEVGLEPKKIGDKKAGALDLRPGRYMVLTVSDTGCGMSPEVLERIFDPYFSTKEKAVGTGLGLAVVQGIVKSYGGGISVESTPGKGSIFKVYFPLIEDAESTKQEDNQEPVPGGNESILVIDDEPTIVDTLKQVLGRLGYRVVARTSSTDALELLRETPDEFDLVITDQTMPHMTGDELAKELMKLRPGIPVILCTGFSEKITEQEAKTMGLSGFLMKPVVIRDLAVNIRRILDEKK